MEIVFKDPPKREPIKSKSNKTIPFLKKVVCIPSNKKKESLVLKWKSHSCLEMQKCLKKKVYM